jgi:hypothetical protein
MFYITDHYFSGLSNLISEGEIILVVIKYNGTPTNVKEISGLQFSTP